MDVATRESYREAILRGLPQSDYRAIDDRPLADFLRTADFEGPWAAIQACVEGVLPVPLFGSREALAEWSEDFPWLDRPVEEKVDHPDAANQFFICLVVSANRRWNPPNLVPARLRLKRLHPRLHQIHMSRIESLPFAAN